MEEETISLKELFETLKKRFLLIILITIAAVLVSGVISYFFLTPIYQASTQILVNKTQNDQSLYSTPNEVQTNIQLVNTYNVIIKSPAILDKVSKELKLGMTTEELNQKITVASEQNSQVINLSVQDPDPDQAATIANRTADVFQTEIAKIMKVDNVTILAKAKVTPDQAPVKPKKLLNMAIALVIGLMAGVGIAFLLEYFDNTIKTEQDVEKLLELPILGVTANIDEAKLEEKKIRKEARKAGARGEHVGS